MVGLWVCIWLLHKEQEKISQDVAAIGSLLIVPIDPDETPVDLSRGTWTGTVIGTCDDCGSDFSLPQAVERHERMARHNVTLRGE